MVAPEKTKDMGSQPSLVIDQVMSEGRALAEGVLEGVAERGSLDGDPGRPHGFVEDARQDQRRARHVIPPSR